MTFTHTSEGLSYRETAQQLAHCVTKARARRLTGIALGDPDRIVPEPGNTGGQS